MNYISGNNIRRKPNFSLKDAPIDTKYFVIAENLLPWPILFFRHVQGPLGTSFERVQLSYKILWRHYDVIDVSKYVLAGNRIRMQNLLSKITTLDKLCCTMRENVKLLPKTYKIGSNFCHMKSVQSTLHRGREGQNAKIVCTRITPLTNFHLTDFSETSSLQQSEAKHGQVIAEWHHNDVTQFHGDPLRRPLCLF